MVDNSKLYADYIREKFDKSKNIYNQLYKNESSELFLIAYESTNIYPVYPRPIIMPLKRKGEIINLEFGKSVKLDKTNIEKITNLINGKIKEYNIYKPQLKYIKQKQKVRRLLDYEIRDKVKLYFPDSYITNAWTKLYELLATYDIFSDTMKDINTFHICEHPGAFIYATKDFIKKRYPNKNHKYIFQSLKPTQDKQIFKAEKDLLTTAKDNLDYGYDGTGDITQPDNIRYYGTTYRKNNIRLITSDCGLDCSADFTNQEKILQPVFMGALLCAINIASDGCDYIAKMFSFHNDKTIEMLYIGSYFFESVDIVRTLTTKSGSGEVYVVFKNFQRPDDFEIRFNKLIDYYDNYNNNDLLAANIGNNFMKRIEKYANILALRRIVTMNQLIFRIINKDYIEKNQEVRKYVQNFADYYAEYYLAYTKINL